MICTREGRVKAIKFVQWQSSILVGVVVVAGLLGLLSKVYTVGEWVQFATTAALFIAPEKLAAFFGPALKRHQEARSEDRCENDITG